MIQDFTRYKKYIPFEIPIDFGDFECVGYFPYATASISTRVHPARSLFKEMEDKLKLTDNKTVFIFNDKQRFGTTDFAIQFKDFYCSVGELEDVRGYGGALELKEV